MATNHFKLNVPFPPAGDQPQAIEELVENIEQRRKHQVLLGVTGSGKTYTVANVIAKVQKPTLVIAHNKTLAAQLYQEFRDFFPENAVSYFVSYYDYYQPEAYIATTDTYIEKEATINDEIDKLRLATTANLLSRPDAIVVASVSCIYNLGNPLDFESHSLGLVEGEVIPRQTILTRLTDMQYTRTQADLLRGTFRVRGDRIQVWPANEPWALNITIPGTTITQLEKIDPGTGTRWNEPTNWMLDPAAQTAAGGRRVIIYPAKHYIADSNNKSAIDQIEADMRVRVEELKAQGKVVEAYRLEQRTLHDVDMLRELGFVNGIENYSRYFDGRKPGEPPHTLLEYFHFNAQKYGDGSFLTVVDESHITLSQVGGMYFGDQSRKQNLIEYGFRLPAAIDNRPLNYNEFLSKLDLAIYVSATPSEKELALSDNTVVEQIVRPTGLIDPPVEIRPVDGQIPNLMREIIIRKQRGQRVLVTTLTKRMSETLTEYLGDIKKMNQLRLEFFPDIGILEKDDLPKVQYLHSDVETIERSEILDDLRKGVYDVLIGVNLLREGLDLPEVTLVAILDADQEGFLRSTSALIQTMGRAARHVEGTVILYANRMTKSMQAAIDEVERRRNIQIAYNIEHNITPLTISKPIREQLITRTKTDEDIPGVTRRPGTSARDKAGITAPKAGHTILDLNKKQAVVLEEIDPNDLTPQDKTRLAKQLSRVMNQAAKDWNFELAAKIRDTISRLEA